MMVLILAMEMVATLLDSAMSSGRFLLRPIPEHVAESHRFP